MVPCMSLGRVEHRGSNSLAYHWWDRVVNVIPLDARVLNLHCLTLVEKIDAFVVCLGEQCEDLLT